MSVLLATQGAMVLDLLLTGVVAHGAAAWLIEAAVFCLFVVATVRRLHDCGIAAWWIAVGLFAVMLWCFVLTTSLLLIRGPLAFAPGSGWCIATLVVVMLPVLAFLVVLHVEPGDSQENAYGPRPCRNGFSDFTDKANGLPNDSIERGIWASR